MSKKILIAKLLSAHGIKGEIKILYFGDDVKNILKYKLFDEKNNLYQLKIVNKNKINVVSNRAGDKIFIVKIEGVNDRNQAELLNGVELFTYRENFPTTKENEFYISDLIGLDVNNNSNQKIGKITNVINSSFNCAIEIEFFDNFIPSNFQKIDSLPFKNEFFPIVNLNEGFVVVEIPEVISEEVISEIIKK